MDLHVYEVPVEYQTVQRLIPALWKKHSPQVSESREEEKTTQPRVGTCSGHHVKSPFFMNSLSLAVPGWIFSSFVVGDL